MKNKIFTKLSIVLNVVFFAGLIILGYRFYLESKLKLFSILIREALDRGLTPDTLNSVNYYNASDFDGIESFH